ncbi:MAG: 23S rRNA (adenine(2030)-N(6))-methyltransferase RlmJ [Treponemataceae bacterium]
MLSYRHSFHAGNHADILKHFTLFVMTKAFCKKEKPFIFYDVHAGRGIYSLESEESKKTGEAQNGILKLFEISNQTEPISSDLIEFLNFEKKIYNTSKDYAGSFIIVDEFSRDDDIIITFELHSSEINDLRATVKKRSRKKISIHNRNGYEGIVALTPPKASFSKRGFILFDPSYEVTSDYNDVKNSVTAVLKKWKNASIAIWYPLLEHRKNEINSLKMMSCLNDFDHFHCELKIAEQNKSQNRLYGSGMLLINPPYLLEEKLQETIPFLEKTLREDFIEK